MKYCVLGGGGSFGIQTSLYLLDRDYEVVGIGRNPLRSEPFSLGVEKRQNYKYRPFHIYYEQDLLLEFLDKEKPEIIINYAAQGEGAVSWRHSWRFFETNSVALSKLSEALFERDWLKHFIQIGTSELYGSVSRAVDETAPIKPTSPYAASKAAFDMYLLSQKDNFPFTILRPCNAYCPAQLLHRVIPRAIWSGLTGRKLPLHGGGKAQKSYIHAADLAHAIYLVSVKPAQGKVYNVGADFPTSISDVVEFCAHALDMDFEDLCIIAEERHGQDSCYWLNSSAIYKDFGWKPEIDWDEGLDDMVQWGNKYIDQIKDLNTDYVLRA